MSTGLKVLRAQLGRRFRHADARLDAREGWDLSQLSCAVDVALDILREQVNLLVIDPFPPGPHDPEGMHDAIWSDLSDKPFELPADKPLTLASYQVEPIKTAYVETIAVGDALPDMPLFLYEEYGIDVPLEETYQATWNVLPNEIRQLLN